MELVSASISQGRINKINCYLCLWPLLGAIIYPAFFVIYAYALDHYKNNTSLIVKIISTVFAVVAITLTLSVSVGAFIALNRRNKEGKFNTLRSRRILHLLFVTPPMYILTIQLSSMLGMASWHGVGWMVIFILISLSLIVDKTTHDTYRQTSLPSWPRLLHGVTALALLLAFITIHFTNHVLALWSVELNKKFMQLARFWYQSQWVEPIILSLFIILAFSGLRMVAYYTQVDGDKFRNLQTLSGSYLVTFFCAHLLAVMSGRNAGMETDWFFAAGKNGLIHGMAVLIPYYLLAAFLLGVHLALGLRKVLLAHHINGLYVDRVFYICTLFALAITILIGLPLLGIHVSGN